MPVLFLALGAARASSAPKPSHKKPGESLPTTVRQPVCYWWDTLDEGARSAFTARFPALAKSFEFHRKLMPRPSLARLASDESLSDWWLGLESAERRGLIEEYPGLKAVLGKLQRGEPL
ncbi:MAG: hypothetical protein HY925_03905 [Elusimicrobia bacterium]|nr:hypothetical protein [Elusimicrobiota bacterium]